MLSNQPSSSSSSLPLTSAPPPSLPPSLKERADAKVAEIANNPNEISALFDYVMSLKVRESIEISDQENFLDIDAEKFFSSTGSSYVCVHHKSKPNDKGIILLVNGNTHVAADIHGDSISQDAILEQKNFYTDESSKLVCIGDYIDRGRSSLEVLVRGLFLQDQCKERCFLLRGNHEQDILRLAQTPNNDFCKKIVDGLNDENFWLFQEQLLALLPVAALFFHPQAPNFIGVATHSSLGVDVYPNPLSNALYTVWIDSYDRLMWYMVPLDKLADQLRDKGIAYMLRGHSTEDLIKGRCCFEKGGVCIITTHATGGISVTSAYSGKDGITNPSIVQIFPDARRGEQQPINQEIVRRLNGEYLKQSISKLGYSARCATSKCGRLLIKELIEQIKQVMRDMGALTFPSDFGQFFNKIYDLGAALFSISIHNPPSSCYTIAIDALPADEKAFFFNESMSNIFRYITDHILTDKDDLTENLRVRIQKGICLCNMIKQKNNILPYKFKWENYLETIDKVVIPHLITIPHLIIAPNLALEAFMKLGILDFDRIDDSLLHNCLLQILDNYNVSKLNYNVSKLIELKIVLRAFTHEAMERCKTPNHVELAKILVSDRVYLPMTSIFQGDISQSSSSQSGISPKLYNKYFSKWEVTNIQAVLASTANNTNPLICELRSNLHKTLQENSAAKELSGTSSSLSSTSLSATSSAFFGTAMSFSAASSSVSAALSTPPVSVVPT